MDGRYQRFASLLRKETLQLVRDRRTLLLLLGLPLVELFLFAYAVSLTVDHIPTALVDQSQDARSRQLVQDFQNSQYFDFTLRVQNERQVIEAIDSGAVKAGVIIPHELEGKLERGQADILVLLDGSDSFSVQSAYHAASAIAQNLSLNLITERLNRVGGAAFASQSQPIVTSTRVLYNPDMKDMIFVLPGIIALILQTLAVGQAALAVVREHETGTIEQILVTPTRPFEMILAKLIPLVGLIVFITGVVLALGVYWFEVPFRGNLWLFFWLGLLFIVSCLGLGLLISTIAKSQKQAQQISQVIMLFSMLLSGIIYPRTAMPAIAQGVGGMLPMTYFLRITRGIMTKGVGVSFTWNDTLALGVYAVIVMLLAAFSFRKRLD